MQGLRLCYMQRRRYQEFSARFLSPAFCREAMPTRLSVTGPTHPLAAAATTLAGTARQYRASTSPDRRMVILFWFIRATIILPPDTTVSSSRMERRYRRVTKIITFVFIRLRTISTASSHHPMQFESTRTCGTRFGRRPTSRCGMVQLR